MTNNIAKMQKLEAPNSTLQKPKIKQLCNCHTFAIHHNSLAELLTGSAIPWLQISRHQAPVALTSIIVNGGKGGIRLLKKCHKNKSLGY